MIQKFQQYAFALISTTSLFLSGLMMVFQKHTYLRLLEPPARYVMVAACLGLPLLYFALLLLRRKNWQGAVLALVGGVWASLGALYLIHPLRNSGWILCFALTATTIASLRKGGYADEV